MRPSYPHSKPSAILSLRLSAGGLQTTPGPHARRTLPRPLFSGYPSPWPLAGLLGKGEWLLSNHRAAFPDEPTWFYQLSATQHLWVPFCGLDWKSTHFFTFLTLLLPRRHPPGQGPLLLQHDNSKNRTGRHGQVQVLGSRGRGSKAVCWLGALAMSSVSVSVMSSSVTLDARYLLPGYLGTCRSSHTSPGSPLVRRLGRMYLSWAYSVPSVT